MAEDNPEIDELGDLIESVEEEVERLASGAADIRAKLLSSYRAKIERWRKRGYNTARIEMAMNAPLEEMEREFAKFESDVEKVESLQEYVDRFGIEDLRQEIESVSSMLFEPGREDEARREIEELSAIIRARESGGRGWFDKVSWVEEEWPAEKDLLEWQL